MSSTPIKIGYCLSLTGGLAANGQTARLAHQIWRERVNARGGLLGREVELICVAFSGTVVTDEDLDRSSVNVSIEAGSVNTHLPVRDSQVRSADFLDAEHFLNITFASAAVRAEKGRYSVDGDLTIRGTTRPVTLDLNVNGFSPDTFGATRASFSATTTIDRNDFGVSFNAPIPGLDKAMLLSDAVTINLDVEAVLQGDGPAG